MAKRNNYTQNSNDEQSSKDSDKYSKKRNFKTRRKKRNFKSIKNKEKEAPNYNFKKYKFTKKKVEEDNKKKKFLGIRLNRFIANAGVCSRREADKLIQNGEISVNGLVVKEMGIRIKPNDVVRYNNRVLSKEKLVYILMNKPKDCITTLKDPEGRTTVMDLLKDACEERIYPVGRLDRNTTGVLFFTNDGELSKKLAHPSSEIKKVYAVTLDKGIMPEDFEKLLQGLELEDGIAYIDKASILNKEKTELGIEIHSGRNRIVRRIFEHLGYRVEKLDRTLFAGLTKAQMGRGEWRFLREKEVLQLKFFT